MPTMSEYEAQEERLLPPAVSFDEFPPPSYEDWKAEAEAALKGAPFEKRLFTSTYEGITLEPLYTPEHLRDLEPPSLPGCAPFLRGSRASGYLGVPWEMAQGCDVPRPEEAGEVLRRELEKGSTTLHWVLDDPTLRGEDAPSSPPPGGGLSLCTLGDLDLALRGTDPTRYPLQIDAGFSAAPLLALLGAHARAQGRRDALESMRGCVGADPLGALARTGSLPCPLEELFDEMAVTIHWAEARMPHLKTVLVRGDRFHDAGASATEELALAAADGVAILRALQARGLEVSRVAPRMRFCLSLGAHFFMEIAKVRAMRRIWSRIVEAFGGAPETRRADLFARTSRFTQTLYDPYVNLLRATSQAFSGVVGGVDGLEVGRFDEPLRSGGEQSRRMARNIQIMLRHEFDLLQPVDPAGGSWFLESLTAQVAEKAWEILQEVEARGGLHRALKEGLVQERVEATRAKRWKNLATRSDRAVGTNMYPNVTETLLTEEGDPQARWARRRQDLTSFLEDRDEEHCRQILEGLPSVPGGDPEGFLDALSEAFFAGATLGEVRTALNDGFRGSEEVRPLGAHRWTEPFEALRSRTEEAAAKGIRVRAFLANLGPIPQHKARADFSTSFLEVARFEVLRNEGFPTVEEAARAAAGSGADLAVICSTDETYPELVPPLARLLKAARPDLRVYLAGAPAPEHKEAYLEAGVDDFIHVRSNCLQILTDIQKARGLC